MDSHHTRESLRILIVEDRDTDTELILRLLRRNGYEPIWTRVDTEPDFLTALEQPLDLILLDAILPQFSAMRALELLREHQRDVPCIVISGSIGEEEAVALMRAGAADYLMKDRLGRFPQAVRHVMEQRRLQEEHRRAHKALISLNEELERRIAARTAELERLNQDLARELAERKQIEMLLRQHEAALERHVAVRTAQLERSHARLSRLASQLTLVEQRERKRLASELHDYLAQLLVVTKLKLHQLRRESAPTDAAAIVRDIESYVDQAITYTRSLVAQLSPTVLFTHGLVAALKWLADYMPARGLRVRVASEVEHVPLNEDHAVLLFQSVRELLFNVVKHAGTSDAVVTVTVPEGRALSITVQDQGAGFDPDSMTEGTMRFGLLSIRERVEGMGGAFRLRSSPGAGTEVELSIPLSDQIAAAPQQREELRTETVPSVSSGAKSWRVLVADDHALLRRELVDILSAIKGLEVIAEAQDGGQAVELAIALQPDLILMDVNMPVLDGIQATRTILARHPGTRIIGVTVQTDSGVHARMHAAGAVASISKELVHSDLEPAIRRALQLVEPAI